VKEEVLDAYRDSGLRSLASSPEISEHLFVAGAHLAPPLVEQLRESLFALGKGRRSAVLTSIRSQVTALVPGQDRDYDTLRSIMERVLGPREGTRAP
jgi:phosphonate transport system substrate-binding protein